MYMYLFRWVLFLSFLYMLEMFVGFERFERLLAPIRLVSQKQTSLKILRLACELDTQGQIVAFSSLLTFVQI